jgi:phosphoglycerol transferase MdoB-like AlkP superfamily enzyme
MNMMKKQLFNKVFYLIAANTIISALFLFIYKMFRYNYDIVPLIQSMHEDTKRFVLNMMIVFLVCISSAKLQLKLFNHMKKQFPWAVTLLKLVFILFISLAASLIVNYYFQYFQQLKDPILTVTWIKENTNIYFAGVLYLLLLFLVIFAVIGNIFISTLLTSFILLVIGFIHYNKLNIRVEPLYPFDYKQFTQMKDVIPMVTEYISLGQVIIFVILVVLILGVLLIFLQNIRINLWLRGLIFLAAIIVLYSYTNFPNTFMKSFVKNNNISIVKWNQIDNYEVNGFLFGFISNLQNDSTIKPEGYSKQKVLETARKYVRESDEKTGYSGPTPNIIYIMSEAFWDPTRLNLKFSEDPIPHLRQLMTEHSSGNVLSPVYGGATANVEFEALTGFTTSFLNVGVIPYQDVVDKKSFIPSIVSDLEAKGYNTLAIHPFNRVFYKRNVVYDTFGFDEFLDQETMKFKKRKPGGVINDLSLTNEIIDNIKKQDAPLFIHAVSMQNHMPYNAGANEDNKIQVSGLSPESTSTLEVYTEGIRRSDEALQLLVDEIQTLNEPTIVVFWGDHLPILGANMTVYKEAGYDDENPDVNEYKYSETPLLIYSNFISEQERYEFISPFYLTPIIYGLSRMEKPPFYNLLDKLREQMDIPALKGSIIMGSNREFIKNLTKEQKQILEDYRLLQYDLLIGKQYSLDLLYK